MTGAISSCLRVVGAVLLILQVALAQKCYYPNGNEAPEKPCSSAAGSACCPDKWECLDNGLCHYQPDSLYGRYSCTDKSWKSSGCASNMCTYGMTVAGGESITQCKDHGNQWCCNGDATNVNCCAGKPQPRPFFNLQDGKVYGVVGSSTAASNPNLASITGMASSGGSSPSSTSIPSPSSTSASSPSSTSGFSASARSSAPSTIAEPTTMTSLATRVSTGSSGDVKTVVETNTITATVNSATNAPAPTNLESASRRKSKVPIIVGCAVGVPLALALIGILFWLLRKRSQQKKNPRYTGTPDPYANGTLTPEFTGGAAMSGGGAAFTGGNKLFKNTNGATTSEKVTGPAGVPELESQSVGPERPVSMVPGSAELDSGGKFAPGTVSQAPHMVGMGGGNGHGQGQGLRVVNGSEPSPTMSASWGSAPPGYSPGMNQSLWAPGHSQQPSSGSADGAASGGGYLPYRPPAGHEAYAHNGVPLSNLPEIAELSAVESPPVVVEAGDGRTAPAELSAVRPSTEQGPGKSGPSCARDGRIG